MIVQGVTITTAQIAAGRAAMTGDFIVGAVIAALIQAGVKDTGWTVERTADRLLQEARKAGWIETRRGRGCWRRIA